MKNSLRIIAIVVVAVLLFGVGFGLGSRTGINVTVSVDSAVPAGGNATINSSNSTTAPTTQTPAPSTDAPAADTPAADTPAADTPANDTPAAEPSGDAGAVPSSTAEIVKAYNDAIAKTKAEQNMTVHKVSDVKIEITDCSIGLAKPILNNVVQGFAGVTEDTWTFAGSSSGTNANGDSIDADKLIPPSRRPAALAESHVASATATAAGDGYTLKITLNGETSSYDGTNTTGPAGNNAVVDPLNLATMDIPVATIKEAEMIYSATVLEATVDGSGRITNLHVQIPMTGTGKGGVNKVPGSVTVGLAGSLDDVYTITY